MKKACFLVFLFFLTHCASNTDPVKDWTIAQRALKRAQKAGSEKLALQNYIKAQKLYKQAVSLYRAEQYSQARDYFQKSILLSEKAELKSLYRQKKEME